jgi:hypothetical protein
MRWISGVLPITCLVVMSAPALSQTFQGRVTGRILDPANAVVPAAVVTATNKDTGISTSASSNQNGIYVLPFLQPGEYTLSASHPGFKRYENKSITIKTADTITLDLQLEIGNLAETVTVTSEAPLLESSDSTVGQFVNSRVVQDMPLSGRRALELAKLAGGVVFVNYGGQAKPNFSLAGGRVQNQMFWLDGGNIQNMRLGIGQVDTDPPVEVIKEFRVVQNGYSAEYGGSAGGLIITTTKSGTNQFHGSAFEFFRNDKMDAAGFFAPIDGDRKVRAKLRYNLFGGTVGGPIIKDRTHFFAGYEGTRRSDGSTQVLNVPTALQRSGDFSQTFDTAGRLVQIYDPLTTRTVNGRVVRDPFPGNRIPSDRIDPVAAKLIKFWPEPNSTPVNVAGAQNFRANRAQIFTRDNVTGRVDHAFSNANRFYFRMVYNRDPIGWTSNYPDPTADPQGTFQSVRHQQTYLFADTHTFTPNLIMDARYSFATRKAHALSAGIGSNIVDQIGLTGVPSGAFPAMNPAGIAAVGNSSERQQFPIRQQQIVNNMTWVAGKHVIKFGGELRKSSNYEINRPQISGNYNFATTGSGLPGNTRTGFGYATFLLGFVNGFSLRETEVLDRYSWYMAAFVQDDWKISRDFTLNLGVRWETDTPITDANNRVNSFDPDAINPVSGTPGVVRFAGVDGWPTQPYGTDWNNFGPRVGFAWRPLGSNRWVVRSGYGIFFEHPFAHGAPSSASLGFERSAALNSPDNGVTPAFYLREGVRGVQLTTPALDTSFGAVPVGGRATTNVTFYEMNRRTGYAQHFNFGIQRELPGNLLVEVTYLGNLGRKMPVSNLNMNQVPSNMLGPGNAQVRRPYPQFNNVTIAFPTLGSHNYHAGIFKIEKRFSHGVSFLSTYTWARNIGNIDQAAGFGDDQIYQDYYNRQLDRGPLSTDVIHRFVWSSVYDLPFGRGRKWATSGFASHLVGGWQIGAIGTVQSGGPFTVTVQTNTTNSFSAGALRANVLRDPKLENPTISRWFDTEAFEAPPAYAFGNAGRGILRGDNRVSLDLSLLKNFTFGENRYIQLRGEMFNSLNHPDFGLPNHVLDSPGFGTVTSATDPRTAQLGLRIVF